MQRNNQKPFTSRNQLKFYRNDKNKLNLLKREKT